MCRLPLASHVPVFSSRLDASLSIPTNEYLCLFIVLICLSAIQPSPFYLQLEKDAIVPLTVSNLIAYSGCSFSSDDKENGDISKKSIEKKKRRKTLFYSKRRRRKPSTEFCEFFECKISQIRANGVVSWVQCDGCDKWFHTDCIGCDYNSVREDTTKFHCGQC